MTANYELLKRLYAFGASGSPADAELAADALEYISALEHSVVLDRPGSEMSFAQLVFMLGLVHAALENKQNHECLKAAAQRCNRLPFHLFALRAQLTDILDAAEMEVAR